MQVTQDTSTMCLRAGRSTYLVFAVMFAIPLLINLFALLNDPSWWEPVIIILLAAVVCFAWLRSFEIVVAQGRLTYASLFRRAISIQLAEIAKVNIRTGCFTYIDRFKPTTRLIIHPLSATGRSPMIINLKVFDKKQIDVLLAFLGSP